MEADRHPKRTKSSHVSACECLAFQCPVTMALVQDMFSGPLDVIGDVHGESGTLCKLLDRLGYDGNGRHPEGRRLIFVGDLIDRGPDSPGVVRLVRHLISQGNAQCILGNHEINILRGERKHGNHWFYGEPEVIRKDKAAVSFQVLADTAFQKEVQDFFGTLPLVLVREDLAVVHACWDAAAVEKLRAFEGSVTEAFDTFAREVQDTIKKDSITDQDEVDLLEQNMNPVKVLSSGKEARAAEPFFAGGKMRNLERAKWWEDHKPDDDRLIIIGHYWRRFMDEVFPEVHARHPDGFNPTGADMFPNNGPHELLGPSKKVMCIDYAAGVRYEERGMGLRESALGTHLAALRLPEMQIHLEDGRVLDCC